MRDRINWQRAGAQKLSGEIKARKTEIAMEIALKVT